MNYDEELLVELVADGRLSHAAIAERVGASRRTVWRIANGISRPDLQRKIEAVAEGYRQAAVRAAARHMTALIEKQVAVALSGQGETSRKCREFLIKTFMLTLPAQSARVEKENAEQAAADRAKTPAPFFDHLAALSPDLKARMMDELGLSRPNIDESDCGPHPNRAPTPQHPLTRGGP